MLNEVKFSDLNNQKKTQTIKDMQRAAHSQGYDMSDPKPVPHQGSHFTVDLTHRKTGKKVTPATGRNLGGAREKGGALDNTLRNSTAETIKPRREIGRADRPAAKAKRKRRQQRIKHTNRETRPFKRKKNSESFVSEWQGDFSYAVSYYIIAAIPRRLFLITQTKDAPNCGSYDVLDKVRRMHRARLSSVRRQQDSL